MAGYNLLDNVSASDADAPWNQEEVEPECAYCGFKPDQFGKVQLIDFAGVLMCPSCLETIMRPVDEPRLSFVNIKGETIFAPPGCDGLCRLDCEAYDPQHAYCQEQGADCEEVKL